MYERLVKNIRVELSEVVKAERNGLPKLASACLTRIMVMIKEARKRPRRKRRKVAK